MTGDRVTATFSLFEEDAPETFTVSLKNLSSRQRSLVLSSRYERYDDRSGLAYFWLIKTEEILLTRISSIETVEVIGSGHAIDDPRSYGEVREPFLVVEDCVRRCAVRLFSRDPAVTRDDLERIWGEHLNCRSVTTEADQVEVKERHHLILLTDPFCTD